MKGSTYSEKAVEQQTRDTPIEAERGTIYDRNGNELAVSVTCYTIWVRPADVKKTEEKDAAKQKAEIEKKTNKIFKKIINEGIDRVQKDFKSDIIGIGNLIYKKKPIGFFMLY